jgi:phospholipid/cholesterol/gamma-HCH transport system permease protein
MTARAVSVFEELGRYMLFLGETIRWTFRRPFDFRNILEQMLEIGYKSLPVTSITIFFTGMVMALQIGKQMDTLMPGSSVYIGSGVTISMFRELAPVLTALLLAGRIGSAIAAQIGTMKVTEQIDALVTLSTNPIQYLAVPRFVAALIMTPCLTLISDAVGVLGGSIIAFFALNVTPDKYYDNIIAYVTMNDFLSGFAKSFVFGVEIAIIACYEGFNTRGGAEGVGRATIQSVVKASMVVLISDYFLTYLMQVI